MTLFDPFPAKSGINDPAVLLNERIFANLRMAKQAGKYTITGTFDELTFYKMGGQYYVRQKSSLTGKRVKKSKAFAGLMKSAGELAIASKLASAVYRTIDKDVRHVSLYRKLTGMAKLLVKKNVNKEDIKRELDLYVANAITLAAKKEQVSKKLKPVEAVYTKQTELKSYLYFPNKELNFIGRWKYKRKIRSE